MGILFSGHHLKPLFLSITHMYIYCTQMMVDGANSNSNWRRLLRIASCIRIVLSSPLHSRDIPIDCKRKRSPYISCRRDSNPRFLIHDLRSTDALDRSATADRRENSMLTTIYNPGLETWLHLFLCLKIKFCFLKKF